MSRQYVYLFTALYVFSVSDCVVGKEKPCQAFAVFWQKVSERVHKQPFDTARAWIELDMDNLRHNVIALKGLLPQSSELMPAMKANAYGHGAVLISKELNRLGIKSFCVAAVSEGIELRRNGVKGNILVLGYTPVVKILI